MRLRGGPRAEGGQCVGRILGALLCSMAWAGVVPGARLASAASWIEAPMPRIGTQDLGSKAPLDAPVRARLRPEVANSEVGEPVVWHLEVEHPSALRIDVDASGLESDLAWVVLGEGPRTGEPDGARPGRRILRASWTLAALEPGESFPVGLRVSYSVAGENREVGLEASPLEVAGLLTPDETAPRPRRGWRDDIPEDPSPPPGTLPALALVLLVPLAWFVRRVLGRGRPEEGAEDPEPSPLEALQGLRAGTVRVDGSRELHYRLTALLRSLVDGLSGEDRSAWTDDEWLAALPDSRISSEQRTELVELFESCAPIKYGGFEPTEFRVAEHIERAAELARHLSDAPAAPPAGTGGAP